MIVDVVHWADVAEGCSRCAALAKHYVTPYWKPQRQICPKCCIELNRFYDSVGWPPIPIEKGLP